MSSAWQKLSVFLFLTASVVAVAQTKPTTELKAQAAAPVGAPVATYNGGQITDAQLMAEAKSSLMKPLSQIYSIKMSVLQNLLADEILAKEAKTLNTTPEDLVKKNATDKVKDPTEAELKALYEEEKGNRMIQGKAFDEVKPVLKKLYLSEKSQDLTEVYIDSLFKKYSVAINLERPKSDVSADDDPSLGPVTAPILLIEFSEFQCPYCKKTRPVIDQLLTKYKDKIRYVFRDYPLSFHKAATDAAMAANCAGDQKKYWEYNRQLWTRQADLSKTADTVFKDISKNLGLNETQFNSCMESKKFLSEIQKDQSDGNNAGVSGTPAYFINGIFLNGAQPYESFAQIIDEELKRLQK